MTAPETVVEIAFNAGYNTPAASRTWTNVSAYVELHDGIGIGFGRQDEINLADANSLTFTLDNTDGRFTAGLATSPYYPNVKIGRPIRVTSTPAGQPASVRFLGYIEEWPVEWASSEAYARTPASASSRLSRLGRATTLPPLFAAHRTANPGDFPVSTYFLLTENGLPVGDDATTLVDVGAAGGTVVSFGSPPTTAPVDGLPMAEFTYGAHYLQHSVPPPANSAIAYEFGLLIATTSVDAAIFGSYREVGTWQRATILELVAGRIVLRGKSHTDAGASSAAVSVTGPFIADGQLHSIVVDKAASSTTVDLYVDGVLAGSMDYEIQFPGGGDIFKAMIDGTVRIGSAFEGYFGNSTTLGGHLGRLWYHFSGGGSTIAPEYDAVFRTGFADDTPGARLARLADYGVVAETSFATGSTPISSLDTFGKMVIALMRDVEMADGGVLFDAPDGTLTYQDRGHRYNATSVLTFDMDLHEIEPDYRPVLDRSALVNEATATTADGVEHFYDDTDSIDEYGRHAKAETLATTSGAEGDVWASWNVNAYAEPSPRVATLTVELAPLSAVMQAAVLALTIGDRISVINHPTQAAGATIDYFIEGYSESLSTGVHRISFNVSPVAPFDNIFRLDHATLGKLDSGNRLGR